MPSVPSPPHATPPVESDPRFPSGPWQGFFLMTHLPGRHRMELHLSFRQGAMAGEGRDMIGTFLIRGKYKVEDGRCTWTKRYINKHDVAYQGYNEGKGIWGVWEIPPSWRGGFHIWPTAMGDPTSPRLAESIDVPIAVVSDLEFEKVNVAEPEPVGASANSWPIVTQPQSSIGTSVGENRRLTLDQQTARQSRKAGAAEILYFPSGHACR
jgi:hypothetical protein